MLYIIGGKFKKRGLVAPKSEEVRPTTSQLRETFFNICQLTIEGANFLDLFAGSGAMGLEALSRGAKQATFVENNRLALAAIKKNISALDVSSSTTLFACDVFKGLAKLHAQGVKFDLIYADPPYGKGLGEKILEYVDQNPLLTPEGSLFLEESSLAPVPLATLVLFKERRVGDTHLYEYRNA